MVTDETIGRIVKAYLDPGPVPAYHYRVKNELRQNWPVLAYAIEQLVWEATDEA